MATYTTPNNKRLMAFRKLEAYILQQRKKNIEIYTNDPVMKRLVETVYPNLNVGLLQISIKQTEPHKDN